MKQKWEFVYDGESDSYVPANEETRAFVESMVKKSLKRSHMTITPESIKHMTQVFLDGIKYKEKARLLKKVGLLKDPNLRDRFEKEIDRLLAEQAKS